jgi:hypothetical protein
LAQLTVRPELERRFWAKTVVAGHTAQIQGPELGHCCNACTAAITVTVSTTTATATATAYTDGTVATAAAVTWISAVGTQQSEFQRVTHVVA